MPTRGVSFSILTRHLRQVERDDLAVSQSIPPSAVGSVLWLDSVFSLLFGFGVEGLGVVVVLVGFVRRRDRLVLFCIGSSSSSDAGIVSS